MEPMWTMEDAHNVVTALQDEARDYGYHLALGGGVLNNGYSDKDLDLYFLPMNRDECPQEADNLVAHLEDYFGEHANITDHHYPLETGYRYKVKFEFDNRRIDVFIL